MLFPKMLVCCSHFLCNPFSSFELDSPTPCALKIADKISEQFDNAVLLMVRIIKAIC